jgi:hypothetical protein
MRPVRHKHLLQGAEPDKVNSFANWIWSYTEWIFLWYAYFCLESIFIIIQKYYIYFVSVHIVYTIDFEDQSLEKLLLHYVIHTQFSRETILLESYEKNVSIACSKVGLCPQYMLHFPQYFYSTTSWAYNCYGMYDTRYAAVHHMNLWHPFVGGRALSRINLPFSDLECNRGTPCWKSLWTCTHWMPSPHIAPILVNFAL